MRALLAICLFTYVGQNMLNVSIAPLARALELREWIVGLAVSAAAVFVTVLSQFWGRRSVAWGRRRVLLTALTLAVIAGTLFAGAVGLRAAGVLGAGTAGALIVAARGPFFGSAVAAIPPTGQALIAEATPDPTDRVRGMAAFSGSIQLSIVIGSVTSSALGAWSIVAPVYATPVFVLAALVIGLVWLPRDASGSRRRLSPRSSTLPWHRAGTDGTAPSPTSPTTPSVAGGTDQAACADRATTSGEAEDAGRAAASDTREEGGLPPRVSWTDRRLVAWIGSAFGMFFASGVVQIIAGFIVQDRLGLTPQRAVSLTAVMLLANAAGAMLTQLVVVPRLGWEPRRLVRVGVTLALVALLVLAWAPSLPLMGAATFAVGLGSGLVGPGFTAGGSLAVTAAEQGGVAGVLNAVGAVTWIFAPVTATALYGWHPLAPFALAAGVLGVSTVTAWTALRPGQAGITAAGPQAS